jgi:hypothetical protein
VDAIFGRYVRVERRMKNDVSPAYLSKRMVKYQERRAEELPQPDPERVLGRNDGELQLVRWG